MLIHVLTSAYKTTWPSNAVLVWDKLITITFDYQDIHRFETLKSKRTVICILMSNKRPFFATDFLILMREDRMEDILLN